MSPPSGPVFVIGCPRSGTTLLTLMLTAHSRIAVPPETRFLLPVVRRRTDFGDLRLRRNRRRLARAVVRPRRTKFRHLQLDPELVKKAVVEAPPTIGSAIGAVFRCYATNQGKVRWGDKLPTYYRNIDLLRSLFPDAQFVHLVRDGRDCVASLKQMRWWSLGVVGATASWVHATDCARRAARRLPAGTVHELRYEDLVASPRTELERLCAFLGETFEPAMLRPQDHAALLPPRQRDNWHQQTRQEVGTSRVGTHVDGLTPAELALVERVAGSRLRRLGYPVAATGMPRVTDLARYAAAVTSMRLRTRVLAARDRRLARPPSAVADLGPAVTRAGRRRRR